MSLNYQKFSLLSRRIFLSNSHTRLAPRYFTKHVKQPRENLQMEYLKSVLQSNDTDWTKIKNNILSKQGSMTEKNIDAVIMKFITSSRKFDFAYSFANYLHSSGYELNLGATNSLLQWYFEISKKHELSEEIRKYILNTHDSLYGKYKVLDYNTAERLLHALCAIDEWKKSVKLLDDIHLSSTPSHSAYSIIIATLFKNNKKVEAFRIIKKSLSDNRPLLDNAYDEWIKYILRKYKDKKTILKYLDELCLHLAQNYVTVTEATAARIKETFISLGWLVNYTSVRRASAQCNCCKNKLNEIHFTDEEFNFLQQNVKDRLIVGSDLFLKTSPGELERFLKFINTTGPYDVVLDGLNIAYTIGNGSYVQKIKTINMVVDYFLKLNKKVLLLGRKHMHKWHAPTLKQISSKTFTFFTDDVSQDDPYFITAAILSGPNTDIVSRDLLRGHKFILKNEKLRLLFQKWQWKHQWMLLAARKKPVIQAPLQYESCAQKYEGGWHIPYEKAEIVETYKSYVNNGDPDCSAWLCLRKQK